MKRKNVKTKYIFLIIILVIMLIIAIFSYTLKPDRKLTKFESLMKDAIVGVEKVVFAPFKFVINKFDDYRELVGIRKKYQVLLPEVDRIDSLKAENIELRKQLDAMKDELNITYTINDYEFLNATVISRDMTGWYNTITIDKGSFNGLKKDMVVVNSKGLIGKITSVATFTSEVKLLTTSDMINKISVTITNGENNLYGLIKSYDYNTKFLLVEGISNTDHVNVGDYVYTSGLGGIFPSGILIGSVKNVKTDEYDLAKIIDVMPAANFDNINYVAVLKRKEQTK